VKPSHAVYTENSVGKYTVCFPDRDSAVRYANIMLDMLDIVCVYIGDISWTGEIPYFPNSRTDDPEEA
jgi:hypothetical protein